MYLVTVDEGYRKHTTEWFYGTSNGEEGWDEDCGYEDIIAWKPLPEPYSKSKAFIKNVAEPFSKGIQDGLKGSGKNVE